MEEPGRLQYIGVAESRIRLSNFASEIEDTDTFQQFLNWDDIRIILINQYIAKMVQART